MANSVCWYGYVLRREDDHVIRRALDFESKGQRKAEKTWKKQIEEKSMKVDLCRENALCWIVSINKIVNRLK